MVIFVGYIQKFDFFFGGRDGCLFNKRVMEINLENNLPQHIYIFLPEVIEEYL